MPVVPSQAVIAALDAVSASTLVTHDLHLVTPSSPIPLRKIREIPGPNTSLDAAIGGQIKDAKATLFDEKTSYNVIYGMSDSEIFYVHENPETNRYYVVTRTNIFLHPVIAETAAVLSISATDFFLIAKDFATLNDHPTVVDPEMRLLIFSTMFKGITIGIFKKGTAVYKAYRTLNNLSIFQEYNDAFPKPVRTPLPNTVTNPLPNTGTNPLPNTVTNPLPNTVTNTGPMPNTGPNPLAPTVTPTTLPCSAYIEDYNTNTVVGSGKTNNEKITCAPEVSDAKSKLTIKLTSTLLPPDQVTFSDVGIEQKDDKWSGFFLDLKATSGTRWIRIDISGKKMKYTIQYNKWYGSWVQKEVEVKFDKDNTYTFDGGTVQYKGTDPFSSGLPIGLIVGVSVGLFLILIIAVVLFVKLSKPGKHLREMIRTRAGRYQSDGDLAVFSQQSEWPSE